MLGREEGGRPVVRHGLVCMSDVPVKHLGGAGPVGEEI